MEIVIDGEDAEKLMAIAKAVGGVDKAISFSLGLCLSALGIGKRALLQPLKPQPQNRDREHL